MANDILTGNDRNLTLLDTFDMPVNDLLTEGTKPGQLLEGLASTPSSPIDVVLSEMLSNQMFADPKPGIGNSPGFDLMALNIMVSQCQHKFKKLMLINFFIFFLLILNIFIKYYVFDAKQFIFSTLIVIIIMN